MMSSYVDSSLPQVHDLVLRARVLHLDGHVAPVVEAPELGGLDGPTTEGAGPGGGRRRLDKA